MSMYNHDYTGKKIDYDSLFKILDDERIDWYWYTVNTLEDKQFHTKWLHTNFDENYKEYAQDCHWRQSCTQLVDNKVYLCPLIAYWKYFDAEFEGQHNFVITDEDSIDLDKINSFEELQVERDKVPHFCGYCKGHNAVNDEWGITTRTIDEYVDDNIVEEKNMNDTKMNQKIKSLIEVYCKDTTNIQSHLDLAKAYYDIKQYASAVTYLNRIAEMSDDNDIIYESLCLASECFSEQRNRTIHVKVCLYHAISVLPDRPEAYFLLSKSMEIEEPFQCYSYCVIAQCHKDNAKRVTDLPFEYDYYKLLFQKAVNAWHAQKVDESQTILYDLYIKYPMDKFYKELVVGNLNQIGWPEISDTVESDLPKKKDPKWSVTEYPTLEITTVIPKGGCVVDCVFCPQKILKKSYNDHRFMTLAEFKTLIDKVPTEIRITFSGFIEPWMNKHCSDMLLYAHNKGHRVSVFTTGIGMNLKDVEKIKDVPFCGGPNGGFTLHLPDDENFAKHPITDKYLNVLAALRDATISNFMTMSMGNIHESVKSMFSNVPTYEMWSRAGNLMGEAQLKPELLNVMDRVKSTYQPGDVTCGCIEDLYHNILLPNGDVSLCCMDYGLDHILGNLYDDSYENIMPEENTCYSKCNFCENGISVEDKKAGLKNPHTYNE